MRSQFEDTVENEMRELVEKYITPVPGVVLDYTVSLRFDPQIEADERDSGNPSAKHLARQKAQNERKKAD